ncbi:hypothetical protein ACFVYG_32630 [Streptomyces sp. NPDC058256]|uniref:hypothetical protein n=1 Tax=Streptomyces sp. NPDC058256 TaxID=3346408 RepID=UPI0036E538B0
MIHEVVRVRLLRARAVMAAQELVRLSVERALRPAARRRPPGGGGAHVRAGPEGIQR